MIEYLENTSELSKNACILKYMFQKSCFIYTKELNKHFCSSTIPSRFVDDCHILE